MSKNKEAALYEVTKIDNLQQMLKASVRDFGDTAAFLTKPERGKPYVPVTYREYARDVHALGNTLMTEMNQRKGSRVAILSETCYAWYVSYLAVVNGEAVVVPLDKELPAAEVNSLFHRAGITCVIYSAKLKEKVEEVLRSDNRPETLEALVPIDDEAVIDDASLTEGLTIHTFPELLEKGYEMLDAGHDPFADVTIDNEEMRILLFTSGTTARSKAVMHNHRSIAANLMGMSSMIYVGPKDVFLSVLPLHHTYECTCGFLCAIYRGCTIAQLEGLRHITKNLAESKTSVFLVVPLIAETMHRKIRQKIDSDPKTKKKVERATKLSRFLLKMGIDIRRKIFRSIIDGLGGAMRLFISGGAYINPDILRDFNDWGILGIQGYGLTECAPILALNRDVNHNPESAGLPLPGVDVKIINKDENGIGEIIGKGPNVMLGYYNDPELTAEAIQGGYFHTGDLGYIDEDGFVIITGRKKNVIVTDNGKNIYPEEIESILGDSPLIKEVIISAKEAPNGKVVVTAEVFPDEENVTAELHSRNEPIDSESIYNLLMEPIREANRELVSYKAVRQLIVRDEEFDKNTSRKIRRDYSGPRSGVQTDDNRA